MVAGAVYLVTGGMCLVAGCICLVAGGMCLVAGCICLVAGGNAVPDAFAVNRLTDLYLAGT